LNHGFTVWRSDEGTSVRCIAMSDRTWLAVTSRARKSVPAGRRLVIVIISTAMRITAAGYLKRFGSVTVLNGHIHQTMQKVEGNMTFHTATSTAFATQTRRGALARPDEGSRRATAEPVGAHKSELYEGRASARNRGYAARRGRRHDFEKAGAYPYYCSIHPKMTGKVVVS